MQKSFLSGDSPAGYRQNLVRLAKCYIMAYLHSLEQEGSSKSIRQHLFQDTLLRKEAVNFLEMESLPVNPDKIAEYEEQLMSEAAEGMKSGRLYPAEYLCRVFELSPLERFCLTLLAASEMAPDFEKVYAYLHNDWKKDTLTIETAIEAYRLFHKDAEVLSSCLSGDSKLFLYLCEASEDGRGPLMKRGLRLRSRIVSFLLEDEFISKEIEAYGSCYIPQPETEPLLLEEKPYINMLHYMAGSKQENMVLFYLYGVKGIGKKLNIRYFADKTNRPVFFLELKRLISASSDFRGLIRAVLTEVIINQGLLCICCNDEPIAEDETERIFLQKILDRVKDVLPVVFLTSNCIRKAAIDADRINIIPIEMAAHTLEENHRFWTETAKGYPLSADIDLNGLADKFLLSPGQIREIFNEAAKMAAWQQQDVISRQLLLKVCFEQIEHNLGRKAQKVKLLYRWEDLILPDYQMNMLKVACDQIRYKYKVFSQWGFDAKMAYGTGLSFLFSGSPGTGKTMAAQVIANELNLELYKIELASVVSKYIGETERNLNEIFSEAKKSQGIIFFDEADVLFSKRSEIKDSNDKYSNMEAAFMLQKIEEYTGIVILATNYQQNIDEAFKRRIKFLIDFPFPDMNYRKKLWLSSFPDKLPLDGDVDINFLARFELSGSNIKNIVLNAAFFAAAQDTAVNMSHLMKAVVSEFTKAGKKLSREDLGEYYMFA